MSIPTDTASLPPGLRHVLSQDPRPDADLLSSLQQHIPVTSERNIWAFWHAGPQSIPAWCRRNILAWMRLNGPSWTVRVVDKVPDSPNHVLKFAAPDAFPDCFLQNTMDGPFVGQHSADFARTAILSRHGGVWLDVGVMLFRRLDALCWTRLADPTDPFEVCMAQTAGTGVINGFVAARARSPMIAHWHATFLALWAGRRNCEGLVEHPLIAPVLRALPKNLFFDRFGFDFAADKGRLVDYVAQIWAWRRVCMTGRFADGFSGVEYWKRKVLLLDAATELWGAETAAGRWGGRELFEILGTRLDGPRDEEYGLAERVVWTILKGACMQSVFHGKTLLREESLATLWDRPENEGADERKGTFAALLRYGSVHYEQTREVPYVTAPEPEAVLEE